MKREILCILFISGLTEISAQVNLVSNPSFETYSSCPVNVGEIFLATPWSNPNQGTPDYFNQCNGGIVGVPNNSIEFQFAFDGVAYAGILAWNSLGNVREYVQAPLLQPLTQGKIYCVSFFASFTGGTYVTDDLGALFTNIAVNDTNYTILQYNAQVTNPKNDFLLDTAGWMRISGRFVADGGESYITIGSFRAPQDVDTLYWGGTLSTYYFIDSITVFECGDTNIENLFIPTAFSPNGDNNNDVLHVRGPIKEMDFYIYNRWGELVYHGTDPTQGWNGTYKDEALNSAVFTYYFRGTMMDGKEVTEKGNITLFR